MSPLHILHLSPKKSILFIIYNIIGMVLIRHRKKYLFLCYNIFKKGSKCLYRVFTPLNYSFSYINDTIQLLFHRYQFKKRKKKFTHHALHCKQIRINPSVFYFFFWKILSMIVHCLYQNLTDHLK